MGQLIRKVSVSIVVFILVFSCAQAAFAHGLIYETKSVDNNKLRITLKWSTTNEAKGIKIKSYYLRNGKVLYITYSIDNTGSKTAYIDYDLSSAIPPLRIMLIKYGSEDEEPFTDIKNCPVRDYIKHLHDAGIINGGADGKFRPDDSMTRAEFVSILAKVLNLSGIASNSAGFTDIEKSSAKNSILLAVKSRLIDGYTDKTFKPGAPVTVAVASKAIYKGFKFKTTRNGVYMKLKINKWYSDYVKKMFDVGVLGVKDNIYIKFDEEAPLSRANAAMMLSRAMSTY